jgi:protein O-mannosyl-transferase
MAVLHAEAGHTPQIRDSNVDSAAVRRSLWRQPGAVYVVLFLLACVPYLNTLTNGFVYDDDLQVLQNAFVQNSHNFGKIFTADLWGFAGNEAHAKYYRPLMTLSLFVLHEIYGNVPAGYHAANLALSGLVACMLYAATLRWTGNSLVAWLATCIFALHPIHSETVAWVTDITDLEAAFFVLLAFWLFLDLPNSGEPRLRSYVLLGGAFALAIFSKETAAPFVVLATIYEHAYRPGRENTPWTIKVRRYATLWAALGVYLCLRWSLLGVMQPAANHSNSSLTQVVFTGFALFAKYMGKLARPDHLQAFYSFSVRKNLLDPLVLTGILIALLFVALVWNLRRRQPVVSFGLLWLFLFLAPALNYRWLGLTPLAERYLFLPSIGFCWCVAVGGAELWRRFAMPIRADVGWQRWRLFSRAALISFAGFAAILCVVHIWERNRDWRDDQTFYEKILQDEPGAAMIRASLGVVYLNQGNADGAKAQWLRVLEDAPQSSLALTNLASLAIQENDLAAAENYLDRARESPPVTARYYRVHALLLEKQGQKTASLQDLKQAVKVAPLDSSLHLKLARLTAEQGQAAEAAQQLLLALNGSLVPEDWCDGGDLALQLERADIAERAYRKALEENPFHPWAHRGLGQIYALQGNREEALREFRASLRMDPRDPAALAGLHRLEEQQPTR